MLPVDEDELPGLFGQDAELVEPVDEDPQAGRPVLEDGRDQLEVLVFAAEEPLDTQRLASLLDWEPERVEETVLRLNRDYEEQGRSFELRRLAGGWQLVARRRHAPLLARLLKESVRPRLSRAALETLAVVAFRQPATKGEIEAVRGVKADAVLRTLLERNLVLIAGRSEGVGRPLLYRTTREFLEAFGLASLQELPRLKEIQAWLRGRERGPEELPPLLLRPMAPGDDLSGAGDQLALVAQEPGPSTSEPDGKETR
jgi:segregation and condensation protein B